MRIVSCFETADPLLNWTRRMRLDAVLLLLFFVVMYDRLTQNPLHEMLGTASLLIVCTHLLVNRTWLRQHFGAWFGTAVRRPRRPSVKNRISTISNVVLLATFAASFISGVMCSQTLFASVTPQVWRMDLSYRTVHVSLSMWFFLAAAVHVGLHARLVLDKWETSLKTRVPGWVVIFGKYGILAILIVLSVQIWVRRDFAFLLMCEMSYITVERNELFFAMPVDLAIFFCVVAVAVHALAKIIFGRNWATGFELTCIYKGSKALYLLLLPLLLPKIQLLG